MPKFTKAKIIEILQNLSKQLKKRNLAKKDVAGIISLSTINHYFGNLGNALDAAGLERTRSGDNFRNRGLILDNFSLFQALYDVELKIKKEPGYNDCSAYCKYSPRPYKKRFGKWPDVLAHYRKWKSEHEVKESIIEIPKIDAKDKLKDEKTIISKNNNYFQQLPIDKDAINQLYGEPIDFRGLRHAPINEQGVVFLFGMISRELGFFIEAIQQGFPDCEGKYLFNKKKKLWAKARIEFEYKALNFQQHGHALQNCDFIVCWENDWQNCPIKVIELKTEILKLPNK